MFGTILRFGRKKKTITNEPARQERYTICRVGDELNYLVNRFFLRYENPYFPSGSNFQYLWKDGEWRFISTISMGRYRNPADAYFDKKEDLESFIKKTVTPGSIIQDRTVSETESWEVPSKSSSCDDGLTKPKNNLTPDENKSTKESDGDKNPNPNEWQCVTKKELFFTVHLSITRCHEYLISCQPPSGIVQYLRKNGEWNKDFARNIKDREISSFFYSFASALEFAKNNLPAGTVIKWEGGQTQVWAGDGSYVYEKDELEKTATPYSLGETIVCLNESENHRYYICKYRRDPDAHTLYLWKCCEWHEYASKDISTDMDINAFFSSFLDALEFAKKHLPGRTILTLTHGHKHECSTKNRSDTIAQKCCECGKTSAETKIGEFTSTEGKPVYICEHCQRRVTNDAPDPIDAMRKIPGMVEEEYLRINGFWHKDKRDRLGNLDNLKSFVSKHYPGVIIETKKNVGKEIVTESGSDSPNIIQIWHDNNGWYASDCVTGSKPKYLVKLNSDCYGWFERGDVNNTSFWSYEKDLRSFLKEKYPSAKVAVKDSMAEILQHVKGIVESKEQPYPPNFMDQVESAKTEPPRIVHVIKLDALPPKSSTYCAFMQDGLQKYCFHTNERWYYTGSVVAAPIGCSYHRLSWINLGRLKDSLHRTCPNHHILYEF